MMVWALIATLVGLAVPARCLAEARDAETVAAPTTAPRQIGLRLSVGFGVGTRAFVMPTPQGVQELSDSAFPAAEFGGALRLWPQQRLGCDVLLAYQTSLAWRLEQQPLFGLPETIAARSQRVELSVAPRVRLGDARTAPSLAFPVGLGLRSFWPRPKQFPVHDYLLGGPQLRVEFECTLARYLRLRLGPELQWLPMTGGVVASGPGGWALGGEASLEANFDGPLRVVIAYRETRARVATGTFAFEDTERFITARLNGEL